ncbi:MULTISPECIES: GNAT family N-acetyltransferase [Priestia]|uniref:GNAT family N-acetyltransferase n=1 Tax=Priestia TaxID=2800373 RepID=UPI0022822D48|nr:MULTISPECIES: GNAT family N-acetyltransferase [Priestia]MCY8235434.1 GNAT family N-acetyltransferase [Priestia endophytica]MED3728382.1 GNAT family N-acetyltransferase [Priestia filamentosa]
MKKNEWSHDDIYLQEVPIDKSNLRRLFDYAYIDFPFLKDTFPSKIVKSAIKKGVLHPVYLTNGSEVYGYALYQNVPELKCIHVLFLAILPPHRSSGLGSVLLERLKQLSGNGLILEVEDPETTDSDAELSIRTRRIHFYERNGFHLIPDVKLSHFGYAIQIMTDFNHPNQNWLLFHRKLYNRVYRIYGVPLSTFSLKKR